MSSSSSLETTTKVASSSKKFKGVWKRRWGNWSSEIRLPNSRERIWLGCYDAPDKAARAFDAASVCLRGRGAVGADLNFPDLPPPCRAGGCSRDPREVKAAARTHANRTAVTAQQATASVAHETGGGGVGGTAATSAAEVVVPVRADGSIDDWWPDDWWPVMAHSPPLFSPTDWGSNAYDFLQVPPAAAAVAYEDMDDVIHGASASSLWSFDWTDPYFRY